MPLLVEDRELLVRFREGETRAMDQVYRQYAPAVARLLRCGFVYQSGGAPAAFAGFHSQFELESALQEVFARAFSERARLSYDGLRPYAGFLRGIARNVVLDQLRRRARRGEVLDPFDDERAGRWERAQQARDPVETLEARRGRELVKRFLRDHCDQAERRLYSLRFEHELSQQAAADEMSLTRIQVRRRETKLKKRLLRFLKRARYL